MIKTVNKTFCYVRLYSADLLKLTLEEGAWVRYFSEFFSVFVETTQKHNGTVVKSLGNGAVAAFDHAQNAVQSAIDLQEALNGLLPYAETGIASKMGLATGQATVLSMDDKLIDYLGVSVDVADQLCDRAHGNAILLYYPHTEPVEALKIHSQAGLRQKRAPEAYFFEQPPCQLRGVKKAIHSYSIFWQATPGSYLTPLPAEACQPGNEGSLSKEVTYFGKVTAFKKERGFGFIQYYTEEHEYKEIYFHMTYVVSQTPIEENDHVQFVIKPGKEGRPQACSVLVMGSRLCGQVESLDSSGSGHISIRNQASEVIRFFILPQAIQDLPIKVNDIVEFMVGSGSDSEGLVATDMTLHKEDCQDSLQNEGQNSLQNSLQNGGPSGGGTTYHSETQNKRSLPSILLKRGMASPNVGATISMCMFLNSQTRS